MPSLAVPHLTPISNEHLVSSKEVVFFWKNRIEMFEKKSDKVKQAEHKARDDGVELESQFIMRVPKVSHT